MSVEDAADGFSQGCDIVMDMTDGEEDGITIVGTYAESALGVFGRNVDGTVTADDMSGRRVAVQMGSEAHSELSRVTPSVTFAYATNLNDCFHMLEAERRTMQSARPIRSPPLSLYPEDLLLRDDWRHLEDRHRRGSCEHRACRSCG